MGDAPIKYEIVLNKDALLRNIQSQGNFRILKSVFLMREDSMPGDLVEVKSSAPKEILTNEWRVLQGNALP